MVFSNQFHFRSAGSFHLGKWAILVLALASAGELAAFAETKFRGITISCQGYGRVWGSDIFAENLDELKSLGSDAVAIHPYARIHADGRVSWRWNSDQPPAYFTRPIAEAKKRGLRVMIKPHLAYWGSPFSWRGAIDLKDAAQKARFFKSYEQWIVAMAKISRGADIFVVGTELSLLEHHEAEWRRIIAAVRAETDAQLTYASNWDVYQKLPFWDALDFIGIQAYFPLTEKQNPQSEDLHAAWQKVFAGVAAHSKQWKKPVLLTELGYNRSQNAAAQPWDYRQEPNDAARVMQARCLQAGLAAVEEAGSWMAGVFLWKWFAGPAPRENFYLNEAHLPPVIAAAWARQPRHKPAVKQRTPPG